MEMRPNWRITGSRSRRRLLNKCPPPSSSSVPSSLSLYAINSTPGIRPTMCRGRSGFNIGEGRMAHTGIPSLYLAFAIALATASGPVAAEPQAGWIADKKSGCRVWNPSPEPEDSITWQGSCADGFAEGNGTLQWFSNGKQYETDAGEFH